MKDINFFSPYIDKQKYFKNKVIYISTIAGILVISMVGLYFWNLYKINTLQRELELKEKFLSSKETLEKLAEANEKKRKTELLKKYSTLLAEVNTQIEKLDKINTQLLINISNIIPNNVLLKSISISTNNIHIEGISDNRKSIAEFEHNLKELDTFKIVHVMSINKQSDKRDYFVFVIKCEIEEVKADAN